MVMPLAEPVHDEHEETEGAVCCVFVGNVNEIVSGALSASEEHRAKYQTHVKKSESVFD